MKTLHGQTVLVLGATGGVGPHVVAACLAVGAHVVAAGRRRTALDALRSELGQHERLDVAECDVTHGPGIDKLVADIDAHHGLDGVVCAFGAFAWGPLGEADFDTLATLLTTNALGCAHVLRSALPRMTGRGAGSIVVLAADRAVEPAAGFATYGASKAAVVHLVQGAALEAHATGVRVNALLPGIIDTEENRRVMPAADPARWASPAAIARATVWLLSDESSGVSGSLMRLPGT